MPKQPEPLLDYIDAALSAAKNPQPPKEPATPAEPDPNAPWWQTAGLSDEQLVDLALMPRSEFDRALNENYRQPGWVDVARSIVSNTPLARRAQVYKPQLTDLPPRLQQAAIDADFARHGAPGWEARMLQQRLSDIDHADRRGEVSATAAAEARRDIRAWARENVPGSAQSSDSEGDHE